MPEHLNPEHQLEYLKELRRKYEEVLADAQKTGDYSEAKKLKEELEARLSALEALFPKPESKAESIENEEFDENRFEKRTVAFLKIYLENGLISPEVVLSSVTSMGETESQKLRDQAYLKCLDTNQSVADVNLLVLKSYAGVYNERAWEIRDRGMKTKNYREVLLSLAGIDTPRAWEIRDDSTVNFISEIALSLTGIDTEQAWDLRDSILNSHPNKNNIYPEILKSISGLDSDRAWELRNSVWENANSTYTMSFLALSLVGLDSERAWDMRRGVYKIVTELESIDQSQLLKNSFAASMAGLESDQAWKWRDEWYKGSNFTELSLSLAGLNSDQAWEARGKVKLSRLSMDGFVSGYNGDPTTAIGWRTAKKYNKEKEE